VSRDLYLLRHAKSSWDGVHTSDRQRGLNNRGRRSAPRMGRALAQYMEPVIVSVSPARRAQLTLDGLSDGWPVLKEIEHRTEEALYTFSVADLITYVQAQPETETALFLLGHNPALTELTNWVCGEMVLANLPTAGFVDLALAIDDWSGFEAGCGRLRQRILPRELENVQ
jgi:phosphohistidine phosphatase